MGQTKPTALRVYLNDEDTQRMKSLCSTNELGQTELLQKVASAGLRAIELDGGRITLPLRLAVVAPVASRAAHLNEPKPAPKR